MTTQANLGKVWAITGLTTDPGDAKYSLGWEAEIPTFQNFNFVLQNYDKNFLALAEKGNFEWQNNINYKRGTKVLEDGTYWFCITDHINHQPSLDTLRNYWKEGHQLGSLLETYPKGGLVLNKIQERAGDIWVGQDNTIIGTTNALVLMAAPSTNHNLLFGNIKGELCVVDVGTAINPDDTTVLLPTDASVFRLYHEGHKPVQSEVAGTIPANAIDGKTYGRQDGNWIDLAYSYDEQYKAGFELSRQLSGDRNSFLDLHAHGVPEANDFSGRLIRYAGANGALALIQTGGGPINITNGSSSLIVEKDGDVSLTRGSEYFAIKNGYAEISVPISALDAPTQPPHLTRKDFVESLLVRNVFGTSAVGANLTLDAQDCFTVEFTTGPTGRVNLTYHATIFFTDPVIYITNSRLEVRTLADVTVGFPSHLSLQAGNNAYPRQTVSQSAIGTQLLTPNTTYKAVIVAEVDGTGLPNNAVSFEGMTISGMTW